MAEMQRDATSTDPNSANGRPRRPTLPRFVPTGWIRPADGAASPTGDAVAAAIADEPAGGRTARQGHETILVAEDEAVVRDMVVAALEHAGYRVVAASTGEDAVRLIDRMGEEIDLLLSDVVMPGMSGPDLYDRARRTRPDLKAVFMSGYSALAIGRPIPNGITLLEKPFSTARLYDVVRETLAAS